MSLVTCEQCGSADLDRDKEAPAGDGIPVLCLSCGHRFRRQPRVVCGRCGSSDVEEVAVDGWGYDDLEDARENPTTASWSHVDRLLYKCLKCRHEWQKVESSRPYVPPTTRPAPSRLLSPRHPLSDEAALRAVDDAPGVHVVYRPDGRALYVGMSRQTRTRIRQHLTGDREASILHEKVGRRLDRELGRSATRDEIRGWLEQCSFAVVYTDDISETKAALMEELDPELNEVLPGGDGVGARSAPDQTRSDAVPARPADHQSVVAEFNAAMNEIYRLAKVEAGYNATVFLSMLAERGPLETARFLIHTPKPSDGFTALWERGRLDLTVEAHVLQERFRELFTDDERDICRDRLAQYGWTGP